MVILFLDFFGVYIFEYLKEKMEKNTQKQNAHAR
jgi:hypothetical protein